MLYAHLKHNITQQRHNEITYHHNFEMNTYTYGRYNEIVQNDGHQVGAFAPKQAPIKWGNNNAENNATIWGVENWDFHIFPVTKQEMK